MKVTLSVAASPLTGSHLLTAICSPENQVTSVQFYVDNAPVGTPDTSPPFTYLWDTTTVPDGIHYVEARASFERSRSASSPRQQVEVFNTQPPPDDTGDAPVNVTLPVITGTTTEGQTLTVSLGEWTNDPTSYTRQWLRCGGGGYATEVLADSPVAWWRMDTTDDASANSNTLTVNGSVPTVAGLIAGDSSLGRNFTNVATNYLTAVHHTSLNLGDTFTLEAWIKLTALPGAGDHYMLISKGNNAYEMFVNGTTNKIAVGKSDVGPFVDSSIALTTGVVYHVVATKAGGTAKLYINGVDRTGTTTAQTLANNTEILALGRYNETATFPFDGVIDEVAFYSTALSAARALAHYNAGASTHSCVPIPSATAQTYALQNADVGKTIRCSVSAHNIVGASPTVDTDETAVIAPLSPAVPIIVAPPTISGTTVVGNTMSCSTGTWANFPTGYAYQWKKYTTAGVFITDLAGATNPTYVLTTGDAGATIKCGVIASNAAGSSAQSLSNLSAIVTTASQPQPTGVILWNADLSTGSRSQYGNWEWAGMNDGVPPLDDRVAVATTLDGFTPAQGNYLMRIRCPGNEFVSSTSNSRTMTRLPPEYTNNGQIKVRTAGYDSSYTWVGLVAPGYMTGVIDSDIWLNGPEWVHTNGTAVGTGVTPHHFRILANSFSTDIKWYDGTWHYEVGPPEGLFFGTGYEKGKWYVFTERYKHGVSPNGIYELWYGKKGTDTTMKLVVSKSGIGTMHPANPYLYMVFGSYRRYTGSTQDMVWYNGGFREYSTSAGALGWAEQILRGQV